MILRRASPTPEPLDVATLARELQKLDPWAFWTVELEPGAGASFAVLGVTGAFVAATCALDGYLVAEGKKLLVDGRPVEGFREIKRAAKALRGKLLLIGASTDEVVPAIVLTRAIAGAPRDHTGVRVLRLEDVVPEITKRERILDPTTAERLAPRIGRVITRSTAPPPDEP